jgi:hypothetical protein
MILHGHGVEVAWDGETLVARGTTADGREAVHAPEGSDRVSLSVADLDAVALFEAPRRVGGVVIVVERSLEEHRLHFRRDTRLEFAALAAELEEAIDRDRDANRDHVDLTETGSTAPDADAPSSA